MTDEAANATDSDRVQEFRDEIAGLRLRDRAGRDRRAHVLGAVMMAAALMIAVGAFIYSSNGNPLEQRDAIVLALGALTLGIVGAAIYVRAAMTQFFRWWLARLTFEQNRQTDRLIEGQERKS